MTNDLLISRFESIAHQIEELEVLCRQVDPTVPEGMALDVIDALADMVIQATRVCPCCGEDAIPEDVDSTIEFGSVGLEADEDKTRATLYIEGQIEAIADWVDNEIPSQVHPKDVINALKELISTLELRQGGISQVG